MRFQKRDGEILRDIYANDGVMAIRQVKEKYWKGKTIRAVERRIKKLKDHDYLTKPSREQYRTHPIPEPICWLGWRGAQYIAGLRGVDVSTPKSNNEYQLRAYQTSLRKNGIRWTREPRWSLLRHDLAVIDFRFAVERAVENLPNFILEKWVSEGEFRSNMDKITIRIKDKNGVDKKIERGVCPDGYFELVDVEKRRRGEPHKLRYLLELDMSTHDNSSFGREKVAPGVEYLKSKAYKERFGQNRGRWLVVTCGGKTRLNNLKRHTKKYSGSNEGLFLFSSLDKLRSRHVFLDPIWEKVGYIDPIALLG